MKNVPNREPMMVAMIVQERPAPRLSAVTPVAIEVRPMLATNQMAPRWRTWPWRSRSGT